MILRGLEGIVEEVVSSDSLKVVTEPRHEREQATTKVLRFTGVEEWIGRPTRLPELVGCRVSVYGWEDMDNVVQVFAIAKVI